MAVLKLKRKQNIPWDFTGIIEYPDKERRWFFKGDLHREDGPAIVYPKNKRSDWTLNNWCHYLCGKRYTKEEFERVTKNIKHIVRTKTYTEFKENSSPEQLEEYLSMFMEK